MSSQIVPLNFIQHGHLKLREDPSFAHFANEQLLPVTVHEFSRVGAQLPIVFVKSSVDGKYRAVAMMGVEPGKNLMLGSMAIDENHLPNVIHLYPISLAQSSTDSDQLTILINQDSHLLSEDNGSALFDEKGEQTTYLQQRAEKSARFIEQSHLTEKAIAMLQEHELLIEQQLKMQLPNGRSREINGVYIVDEKRLAQIGDEPFLSFRKSGLLVAIYAHLMSLQHIHHVAKVYAQSIEE